MPDVPSDPTPNLAKPSLGYDPFGFPILSRACSDCMDKPCGNMAQREPLGVGVGSVAAIPMGCPLIVTRKLHNSPMESPLLQRLASLPVQDVIRHAGRTRTNLANMYSQNSTTLEILYREWAYGSIVILHLDPFDTPYRILTDHYARKHARWVARVLREKEEKEHRRLEEAKERPKALLAATWRRVSQPGETQPAGSSASFVKGGAETLFEAMPGERVGLHVVSEGLMPGDRITFTLNRAKSNEKVTLISATLEDDKAFVLWSLPLDADKASPQGYTFTARHFQQKLECPSPALSLAEVDEAIDTSLIFYAPAQDKYLILELEDDIDTLRAEADAMGNLRLRIVKALEEPDPKARLEKSQTVEEEIKSLFKDQESTARQGLEELLLVKRNPRWGKGSEWVHVPPHLGPGKKPIPGEWVKPSEERIKKRLEKALKQDKKHPQWGFNAKLKGTLLKTRSLEGQWPWEWNFGSGEDRLKDSSQFRLSAQAQFCRYVAGAGVDTAFDMKKKQLSLTGHGDVGYSLLEGKIIGSWHLPDKDGGDLYALFNLSDKARQALVPERECRFKIEIKTEGYAFAGVRLSAYAALPNIDLSENLQTVDAGGGTEGYAGARAEGELGIGCAWSPHAKEVFQDLGVIKALGGFSAGVGGSASMEVSYKKGVVWLKFSAMLVWGLGGKGGFALEIGVDKGFALLAHLFHGVNYHYVGEVLKDAFQAYTALATAQYVAQERMKAEAMGALIEEMTDIGAWLGREVVEKGLEKVKSTIRSRLEPDVLRQSPPEASGHILKLIMQSKEPGDYEAILEILESAQSGHELKWMLRNASGVLLPNRRSPDYETKKKTALEQGHAKIMEFGNDNEDFIEKFENILKEVKP